MFDCDVVVSGCVEQKENYQGTLTILESWTEKYSFVECNENCKWLICNCITNVCKEHNLERHYDTEHTTFLKFEGEDILWKTDSFLCAFDHQNKKKKKKKEKKKKKKKVFVKTATGFDNCEEVIFQIESLTAKGSVHLRMVIFAKKSIMIITKKKKKKKIPKSKIKLKDQINLLKSN